jgi:hypothetical protein
MEDIAGLISKYGFPIVASFGLGYFIYYVWLWVTKEVNPIIGDLRKTLINLVDKIRLLDNDIIRLNEKIQVLEKVKARDKTK